MAPDWDEAALEGDAHRAAFLETCVGAIKHKRGLGVTTFIAKTLGVN